MVIKPRAKLFIRVDYRKRALEKYQNLSKFATDLEHFLEQYHQIVGNQPVPPQRYHRLLKELEATLRQLISKYERLGEQSCWSQKYEELFCCAQLFKDFDEFSEHFLKCHYTPRVVDPKIVEYESGRAKLENMQLLLQEYLNCGSEYSAVIVANLRKLLAKVSRPGLLTNESDE
ncbi:uncharacterized protein LOC131681344 [Topomyia yanbarensis]|uniref:uncharacterized protein LOC131681344 n=1 Tax=Topomyia yanbarensis TaxID=2498891 RepID=UPI00273CC1A6|nr:uncharacterized protein LOC131681344 [Topomyia yanbarensis]